MLALKVWTDGDTVTAWVDETCTSVKKFAVVHPEVECYDLGPDQILSISVVC